MQYFSRPPDDDLSDPTTPAMAIDLEYFDTHERKPKPVFFDTSQFGSDAPKPKPAYVPCSIMPCLHYLLSGAAFADVYATIYISLVIMGSSSTDNRTWRHRKRGYPACWMILSWIMLSAYVCSILLGHSFNTWNATATSFSYDPFPPELPIAPPEYEEEIPWGSEWDPDDLYASYYHRYVHQLGYGAEFDDLCSHEGARSILIDSLFDEDFSQTNRASTTTGHQCAASSLRLGVDEISDSILLTSSCTATAKYSRLDELFDLIIDTGASISITHDIRDFVGPLTPLSPAESTVSGLSSNVLAQGIGMIVWNLHDEHGKIRKITTPGYYIPESQMRLFSPISYFRHHGNKGSFSLTGPQPSSFLPMPLSCLFMITRCPCCLLPKHISRGRESARHPINRLSQVLRFLLTRRV